MLTQAVNARGAVGKQLVDSPLHPTLGLQHTRTSLETNAIAIAWHCFERMNRLDSDLTFTSRTERCHPSLHDDEKRMRAADLLLIDEGLWNFVRLVIRDPLQISFPQLRQLFSIDFATVRSVA